MNKAFTLFELIVVIIIMGMLGIISVEILQRVYKDYIVSRELSKLSIKTDNALNILAAKLRNRIKNSVIAVECNASNLNSASSDSCLYNGNKNFISISRIGVSNNSDKYPVLEWLYVSSYSKKGMWWDDKKGYVQPGWSGFVDLKETNISSGDEYNISTPDSNFTIVQYIDGNYSQSWGVRGFNNVFDSNITVLVFSGSDGRGDFKDMNSSYGYYDMNATRVFKIKKLSDTELNLKAFTESNSSTVYEGYYLVRGAMAVVPVYISKYNDYNLTLRFNYFPWNHQNYMDGNVSVLASHVTQFKFKEEKGVLRIYMCISSPNVKFNDYNLTICKEKVVF